MALMEFELCIKPESNLTIWRYMSLEKFESILSNCALFFCRADRFSDPFEGSIPRLEAENRYDALQQMSSIYFNSELNPADAQTNINAISSLHRKFKKQHIINCWHINNTENDSMWRLYLKSNAGVAIQTTIEKLEKAFSKTKEKINYSKVRYLNYENDIWYDVNDYPIQSYNMFIPLVHKRIEFKQEAEIRLIHFIETEDNLDKFWKFQPFSNGMNINVEVNELIDIVHASPTSDIDQISKIQEIIKQYGFNFKVLKSGLTTNPYY